MNKEELVSELKQVTASSDMQAAADPNKMHYDSIENLAATCDRQEATILSTKLVERYPEIVCDTLLKSLVDYHQRFDKIKEAIV